jgi:hypothetical protein
MSLDKAVKNYREIRREQVLKTARSFKEFLQWSVNFLCVDVCGRFGVLGGAIMDYQAFAKKVVADWYDMVLESTVDPSAVDVDTIMDYYERVWCFPRRLNPDIVKALEEELLKLFENVDKLKVKYEELKGFPQVA